MTGNVRPAWMEDAAAIHRLNRDEFGYDYDSQKTRERLRTVLTNGHNMLFVAERDGRVVGYVHAEDYDSTYAGHMKNIMAIAVEKPCRRKGVGRALLRAVEDWAQNTGACGIRLSSGFNREEAHLFYQRCGYAVRKKQMNFVKRLPEPGETAT